MAMTVIDYIRANHFNNARFVRLFVKSATSGKIVYRGYDGYSLNKPDPHNDARNYVHHQHAKWMAWEVEDVEVSTKHSVFTKSPTTVITVVARG